MSAQAELLRDAEARGVAESEVAAPEIGGENGMTAAPQASSPSAIQAKALPSEPQPGSSAPASVSTSGLVGQITSTVVEAARSAASHVSASSIIAPQAEEVATGSVPAPAAQQVVNEITELSTPKYGAPPDAEAAPAAAASFFAAVEAENTAAVVPAVPGATVTASQPATTGLEEAAVLTTAKSTELVSTISAAEAKASKQEGGAPPAMPAPLDKVSLKSLQTAAADIAKQAGNAYIEAGKEARSTMQSLFTAMKRTRLQGKKGEEDPITLTVDQIITAIFLIFVAFNILLIPIFMPSFFRLVYSLVWGLVLGLGLSFLFYYNQKRKKQTNELLSINLGLKGMHLVAGGLPSWFNMSQYEKLEWLNRLIVEFWPYVDKGVCEMIKETTAKVMPGILKGLPAGLSGIVKSIGFKHLTFGDAPFRVETIWVSRDHAGSLVLELSVKWAGDPNITLAIEIPGGQKLCPRVMDISFVATVRVMLHPLVSRIPGFIAVMATVPKPPLIKYRLDFGKAMGGSMAPAAVTPVINYFVREIITKMLVWPQRVVIPVLQDTEQDRVEIQKLMRRHRGVIRINVVAAKELKSAEWGANDIMVELTTDSEHYECTSTRRAKLLYADTREEAERLGEFVAWNEYIYLLIQEPADQLLRMEAFDIDRLRPGKLLTGQVTQVVNGRQLIGRSLVRLADACRATAQTGSTPEPYAMMAHLGKDEWGTPGGPGKGFGKVRLSMTYWPFERFTKYDVENAMTGIVTVRLLRVWGLAAAGDSLSAFVRVTSSANRREWRSSTKTWTRRAHIARLKAEMARLQATRLRDLREGRKKEAEKKGKYIEALADAINGKTSKARLTVDMDFSLDSSAMHAIYHVKLTDVIKIKVLESSLLASSECLGRLDMPVSDVITANDFNPMTGQREFGLHRKRWEDYNPNQPERGIDELERGILLDEGDGARIWVELRWVPCIQAIGEAPPEDPSWAPGQQHVEASAGNPDDDD